LHAVTVGETAGALGVDRTTVLSTDDLGQRHKRHGPKEIAESGGLSPWYIFCEAGYGDKKGAHSSRGGRRLGPGRELHGARRTLAGPAVNDRDFTSSLARAFPSVGFEWNGKLLRRQSSHGWTPGCAERERERELQAIANQLAIIERLCAQVVKLESTATAATRPE